MLETLKATIEKHAIAFIYHIIQSCTFFGRVGNKVSKLPNLIELACHSEISRGTSLVEWNTHANLPNHPQTWGVFQAFSYEKYGASHVKGLKICKGIQKMTDASKHPVAFSLVSQPNELQFMRQILLADFGMRELFMIHFVPIVM